MARRKKTKVRTKRVVKRVSGGRRSGAGRKSIEVHFAALSDLLNERFSQLFAQLGQELPPSRSQVGYITPEAEAKMKAEASAPEEKPRKRRLKIADDAPKAEAAPQPAPEVPVPAPIPVPVAVAPVAHPASPEVVAPPNPWAVPAPVAPAAPASTPENGANSFESQFAALNKS